MLAGDRLPSSNDPRVLGVFCSLLRAAEYEQVEAKLKERGEFAKLRKEIRQDIIELERDSNWLAERSKGPPPDDIDAAWLTQALSDAEQKEQQVIVQFQPVIKKLEGMLVPGRSLPPEVEELVKKGIIVLEGRLEFYRGLREMLARFLNLTGTYSVVGARLVKGKVDHAALTREIMARYPKILAALAK